MRNVNKKINITLIFMLISVSSIQNIAYSEDISALRIPLGVHESRRKEAFEITGQVKRKHILPFLKSIYEWDFVKTEIPGSEKVLPLVDAAYREMVKAGYEPDSILAKAYTEESLHTEKCSSFEIGRLKINCFEARSSLPRTTGYVKPRDKDYEKEFYDKAYVFSIENKNGEVIGHGILIHSSEDPHTVFFRYSIHGSLHIAHQHDFSRKGYGAEALLALMIISKRGDMFSEDIQKLQYEVWREDYGVFWNAGMLVESFMEMRKFLLKMGFIDESKMTPGPIIVFYINKPKAFDSELLAQMVADKIHETGIRDSDITGFLIHLFELKSPMYSIYRKRFIDYVYAVTLKSGMLIPKDMDWENFAERIWDKVIVIPEKIHVKAGEALELQKRILDRCIPGREYQDELPGTRRMQGGRLLGYVYYHQDWVQKENGYKSDLPVIDFGRKIHYYTRFPSDFLLLADGDFEKKLNICIELPAQRLVRIILSLKGTIFFVNAYGEGPYGIFWKGKGRDGAVYFTPLTLEDYKNSFSNTGTLEANIEPSNVIRVCQ